MARSYGVPLLSDGGEVRIGLHLAQEELAQLLGASRNPRPWSEEVIRIEPGGLVVRNREALMRIVETEH